MYVNSISLIKQAVLILVDNLRIFKFKIVNIVNISGLNWIIDIV